MAVRRPSRGSHSATPTHTAHPSASMEALLGGLASADNATRAAAEAAYAAAVAASPAAVARGLTQHVAGDADAGRRAMACVMLRRLFDRSVAQGGVAWDALDAPTQAAVRDGLLAAMPPSLAVPGLFSKLSHAIAEVAQAGAGPGGRDWPALLPCVFELARSADARSRELAVGLFGRLCEYAGDELMAPHGATLQGLLPPLLSDASNAVRIAALSAVIALLAVLEDDAVRAPFQGLLPAMMKVGARAGGSRAGGWRGRLLRVAARARAPARRACARAGPAATTIATVTRPPRERSPPPRRCWSWRWATTRRWRARR